MFATFRRLSKSKLGVGVMVAFLLAILGSFAMADINSFGKSGSGQTSGSIASAGGENLTERDISDIFSRALAQARETKPETTPADLARDFNPLVDQMLTERALTAFAGDHRLLLSKRLVDAEIAKIPGARGLDGKFSENAYRIFLGQQRLTDATIRRMISADLTQRLLSAPVAANARVPLGVATNYASMLLEQRTGEVTLVAVDSMKPGLNPSAGDIQSYYDANKARYIVPEQRVLRTAQITPASVGAVTPSEADIATYYKAHSDKYGGSQNRVISQAVVPDKKIADGIAQRARAGAAFAAAAAPAGLTAEDVSVGPQTRAQFGGLAGDAVANAAFAAASGAIVGPVRSDLGWHVIRIDAIEGKPAVPLAAARGEIVAALTADKAKEALADLVAAVEDKISGGASLPEAAAAAKLTLIDTPLLTANGASRTDPAYKFDPAMARTLKSGFDLSSSDDPVVEELAGNKGYVLVGVGRIVPATPAALADIRTRVAADWIQKKANDLARASASTIAARLAAGQPMSAAIVGTRAIPPRPLATRRISLGQAGPDAVTPLKLLFALAQGHSRMIADPQGRGYYVVKTDKIIPGNAGAQPGLIVQVQQQFQHTVGDELAQQFANAVKKDVGVKRDEKAIAALKTQLTRTAN